MCAADPLNGSPAHIPGMNAINRIPAGVPSGGQFAEGRKSEAEGQTLAATPAEVELDDGGFAWLAGEDQVYDGIEVCRTDDGQLVCTPYLNDNLMTMHLSDEFADASDEDKEQYLEERSQVIADHYRSAYDAEISTDDGRGPHRIGFRPVTFADAHVTEAEIGSKVWDESTVRDYNARSFTSWRSSVDHDLGQALADYDRKPLPPQPLTISPQRREAIRDQVHEALIDTAEPHPDGPELTSIDDIDPESRQRIDARLDSFLDDHSGDIAYLGEQTDYQMTGRTTAADVALAFTGDGTGPGFKDGTDGLCSQVAARRLDRSAATGSRLRYEPGRGYVWGAGSS